MLSKKEFDFLNLKYPLVKPQNILILFPALAVIVVLALIILYGQTDLFGYGVAVLSGAVVFATSLTFFIIAILNRRAVRNSCVAVTHGIAFRVDKNEFDPHTYRLILDFTREIIVYDILGMAVKALNSFASVPLKKHVPMLFVTIRPIGKLFVEGRYKSSRKEIMARSKGLKEFQWRQIEWVGYRTRARRMILHEVAHVILSSSKARYDFNKQHNLINASGVECVLEVVQKDV